ncbi:MAG: amino acid adenylation domain-containing protein [Pseudomonadota bacterium]
MNMKTDTTLSAAKQALLNKWVKGKVRTVQSIARRATPEAGAPLSFAQQRLWFLDQFEAGSAFYNMPIALRLSGALDCAVLARTINEVLRRHEVLRTRFVTVGEQALQVIDPAVQADLPVTDLCAHMSGATPAEREARAMELAQQEAQTPFDLHSGPVTRASLIRLGPCEHIILFTVHHIAADGWSMGILVEEVAALYAAFAQGLSSPLPELPIQYADFAQWQRERLSGDALQGQLDYWTRQLAGAPSLLALPTDRPRPAIQSYRGAVLHFPIPGALVRGLHLIGKQCNATLFMALAAALNILLSRYSGQSDICIGTPVANRTRPELEPLIGFFVNTLVLRCELDANASFSALLEQVRRTALDAYAHQDVPFEQLVDALKPERQTMHAPLFQVMLGLQNTPGGDLDLAGLRLEPVVTERTTAKFDLMLNASELADGSLACTLEYSTDLFDGASMLRLAAQFERLIGAIVADPGRRIHDLDMLGHEERTLQLVSWNDSAANFAPLAVHQRFEQQVLRTPECIALSLCGAHLSYAQLNSRANQLAHHLDACGVGPDVLVGICLERSFDMVAAVLAVLKAGGAYVALDPGYPQERLAMMLDDAAPALVLTQASMSAKLVGAAPLFAIDTQAAMLATCSSANLDKPGLPQSMCYVIYTSGSTGRPKGVGLSVAALGNLIAWQLDARPNDGGAARRTLQFASLNFDVSFQEIFSTLCAGDSLVLIDDALRKDMQGLRDFIAATGFQQIFIPNAVLQQFASLAPTENPLSAAGDGCDIISAGEQLVVTDALKAYAGSLGGRFLYNQYGPSETHVASQYRLDCGAMGAWPAVPPIGRPIANTRLYVLDTDHNPVPRGAAGELYIGGLGVARGYHRRPALSAEKFVPDPFSREPGARMYRSGDLARFAADGNIEFLGRIDGQVKLRGFRIELGEIEATLSALSSVREAVVLVREDVPDDRRLVAYVVAAPDGRFDQHDAQRELARTLPDYMVPAHFVVLDALPLNANGKVDRQRLPTPDMKRVGGGYTAPQTPLQEAIATVWAELLKLDQVGIDDNFFSLGGHSLLATQLVARLRTRLGINTPVRTVFEAATVRSLAQRLDQSGGAEVGEAIPTAQRSAALPLSFAQQRLWFLDQLEKGSALYNLAYAVRLDGQLDVPALTRTLNEIVRRHEALRTTFSSVEGSAHQVIAADLQLQPAFTDLSDMPLEQRAAMANRLAQEAAQTPFDLQAGPLMRVGVVRCGAVEHVLLLTMHHIVADGWSIGVLVDEIVALYTAFVNGQASPLKPLAIQYADFAHWQRARLDGAPMQEHLQYWRGKLDGAPSQLTLATDRARPAVQSYRGATCTFELDAAATRSLHALGQAAQASLFMTLTAAFNVLLSRYSGQFDICVGTPIAARERADLEALIGFFVNTLVLRTHIDPHASFLALLEQVKATALDAYAHQELPFEQLVDATVGQRQLSHAPLFQVMLVLQNAPMRELSLPGLRLQPVPTQGVSAKFDLTLNALEDDQQLRFTLEYNTDLFDAATIERMSGHFVHLLAAIAASPQTQVGQLPMLTQQEEQQLALWSDPLVREAPVQCIHQAFEAQVARTPQGSALVHDGVHLSYTELNARANRLAHRLRELGVGPDVLVGLCAERSFDMIVGVLGILKAGGAYVPLDPSYPAERLAYMLADCRPAVLVTQQHLRAALPQVDAATVCIDADLAAYSVDNPLHTAVPQNLAYVIYTSGSTGKPKGAQLQHDHVMRLFASTDGWFGFDENDSWTLFHSYAFDFSVWEIWGALLHGGKLVLVPHLVTRAPDQFHALLLREQVTVLNQTPSAFQQLQQIDLEAGGPQALALRLVIFGGEALKPAELAPWFAKHGDQSPALVNMYGITETTVHVTYSRVRAEGYAAATVGRPIPDLGAYILDASLNQLPVGVAGELHVAGAGLARAYLNRPELTAERFIPNPFGTQAGSRLYKSGDLARFAKDGSIEYLGRIDHQVKIRGFRIELGEIEAALVAQAQVREAVVLAREDVRGDQRLVAYVVAHDPVDGESLRGALLQSLPDYMVPAHFVMLDELPLSANGKVERTLLPAPDMRRGASEYAAPASATEQALAAMWATVLTVERVGVHDNFFSLGGHSLLATQLVAKIRTGFAVELPLRALFESPTVGALATCIDALGQTGATTLSSIDVADRNAVLPLSYAQKRFWFLDQLQSGSAFYSMPLALTLHGELDVDVFRQVFNILVARHEPLRTIFVDHDGVPRQHILPQLALALPLYDLSDIDAGQREQEIGARIVAEAAKPFHLAQGPLIRTALLKRGAREHVFLLTLHHILYDGWSMGVLLAEVTQLYGALRQGLPSPLLALPIQYADYTLWEQERLSGHMLDQQLDFWRDQLAGAQSLLALPTDRPRPSIMTHRGAALCAHVPVSVTQELVRIGQQRNASLFMVLSAAFNVLLNRYTGQDDLCVAALSANRPAGTEALIGIFVNILALRSRVRAGESFGALLERTRDTLLAAYERQLPFELVLSHFAQDRDASYMPYAQVALNFHNEQEPQRDAGLGAPGQADALTIAGSHTDSVTHAHFEIKLEMGLEHDGSLKIVYEYNTDLFDAATIERMSGHFAQLLDAIAASPQTLVGQLPMLTREEQQQLALWSDPGVREAPFQCIHQAFEAQVARTPQRSALVHDGVHLSYAQLNARANRLAHRLRELGVGPDVLVGLCAERSFDMIVGVLGILKAGGAYVPLDPSYPAERLAYMLADCRPAVLVTQQHLRAALPQVDAATVCIDADLAAYSVDNPLHTAVPQNLAYVIYTSGSTGKPKGAQLQHDHVMRLFASTDGWFGFDENDSWTLFHSYAFDFSVWEIWGALLHGGKLVLVPHLVTRAPDQFHALLLREQVTVLNQTPSAFQQLQQIDLEAGGPQALALRLVIFGGEALKPAELAPWFAKHGDQSPALVNMYGITETTVHVTYSRVRAEGYAAATVGRPIPDLGAYILDASLNQLPVGVAGELHVAGAGLARAYLNRPELTAERFIPNPFAAQAGSRLYKSGDLARFAPDGSIEYLGRIDHQVKIRGFRIELGEIEAALVAQAQVREAVVLAREDVSGDQRLVAYVVAHAPVDGEALRGALLQNLPDYMVPAHFVMLDELPLSANGKVERKLLPAPDMRRGASEYEAPASATEQALAAMWADVLTVERVGLHDNFFSLGGHSLLATQLVSRVRAGFSVEMPLRALFEAPTLHSFAQQVDALRHGPSQAFDRTIKPVERIGVLPLSFAQQRLWFLDQLDPAGAAYNIPFAVRLTGALDVTALARTLNDIVARHEALRTTFAVVNGAPQQVVSARLELAIAINDLRSLPHAERDAKSTWLLQDAAQAPFDLQRGPLLRAGVIRMGDLEHILLLTMHHIVSDGWSIGVLVREVAALYGAHVQNLPSPLPALDIQYPDFAHWQRERLAGPALQRQFDYWGATLHGAPTLLALPTDRPRPAMQTYGGATHHFTVEKATTTRLHAVGMDEQATLFMTLAAAFNVLLARYSGQSDICIGTPVAGRERTELEPLIGLFVNTLVLRSVVDANASFKALLAQVKCAALDAFAHQDVPFEQLVDMLKLERQLSHPPLFQVMLVLQNAQMGDLDLPGLALQPLRTEIDAAKFDLTLNVGEHDGRLLCSLEYNTDLFDAATIAHMADHFNHVLAFVASHPERPVHQCAMLSSDALHQQLVIWNDTAAPYPDAVCVHQLFEMQAERSAQRTALVHEGRHLTYAALNARANQLAHHLRELGVGPDVLVGICVERSLEMVVGVLAILKAGGAYVPLDPNYPVERIAYMVADARPAVVLTQRRLVAFLPAMEVPLICLDDQTDRWHHYSTSNLANVTRDQNLVYIIYTSGSTGRPKGTAIHQRGFVNLVNWFVSQFGIGAADNTLLFSSFSFDLTQKNIFAVLTVGGELHLSSEGYAPHESAEYIRAHAITLLNCAPSAFYPLLAHHSENAALSLRQVFLGGEPIRLSLLREAFAQAGTAPLVHNTYGPTEASDVVAFHTWDPSSAQETIPIGRPVFNTSIYLLDEQLNPVPVGASGELHIGGDGVGRGYRDRPDLTAEKFIPDPFSPLSGARMYKSGDLARFHADGSIEYLGRIDLQVKVRGFRIELGEIENALMGLAYIREAVVVAREDVAGDQRLVAYVVRSDASTALDVTQMRAALLEFLAPYMVPAHFIALEALPLSPNGKVDRKALPAPDTARVSNLYMAPRTPIEVALAAIWAQVLRLEQVGATDNFFELGGHSLLAVQVISKIRSDMGVTIALEAVFGAQTLDALARHIDAISAALSAAKEVAANASAPAEGFTRMRI